MKDKIIFKTLMLKGDAGEPTDQQTQAAVDQYMQDHPEAAIDETIINSAVSDWLDDHPEATTSVQDGSLTYKKLVAGTLNFVTPEMFGAIGDGVTDDTEPIQNALNAGLPVVFSRKTYLVIADQNDENHVALSINSNTVIIGNGAIIKLDPNSYDKYRIIRIYEAENVYIDGLIVSGDIDEHTGTTGEAGHGVSIVGSSNIHIDNCIIENCWGDGVNISATYASLLNSVMTNDVYINNFETHHNRRQGISVEGCDGFYLDNAFIHDISGVSPEAAIDFEPSQFVDPDTQDQSNFEYIDNVFISNLKCQNVASQDIYFEDRYSTQKGKYFLNNCTVKMIRISSLITDSGFGSEICFDNIIIDQQTVYGRNPFEINVYNPNTVIVGNEIIINRNGTYSLFLFDSAFGGSMHINGLSLFNGDPSQRLFEFSIYSDNASKGIVINDLYANVNLAYTSIANENKAQSGAVVSLANDIIESAQSGWFNVNSIANVYYFGSDVTKNSYIQLPQIYDGYEITIINESEYNVDLQKENSNRPNIYFDTILTSKNIRLSSGSMAKLKFITQIGAWVLQNHVGSVAAT